MVAIKDIAAQEEITVMYGSAGYYEKECGCEVCEKKDPRDLSGLKDLYRRKRQRVEDEESSPSAA